jgi:uncharacterized damage-inducible protein DinB
MSMRALLSKQFNACYDENGWFVCLKTVLDGVTAEQAEWKPDGSDNSIHETVYHILFWNERWVKRYRGELNKPEDVDNDSTFDPSSGWSATLERLWAVMDEWKAAIASIQDDKLTSHVNAEYAAPWYEPLAHQNVHNAYHIGQILLLRKLQGSWDPTKGVS